MALSDADTARLSSLRAAYDQLIAGSKVAKVVSGGRTLEYGPGDAARLKSEIDELAAEAAAPVPTRRRGAIRFRVR